MLDTEFSNVGMFVEHEPEVENFDHVVQTYTQYISNGKLTAQ